MKSTTNGDMPIHYRYEDYATESGLEIKVSKFYPVRETRCFYFVTNEWENESWIKNPSQRRVSKDSMRRYCYPTKKEALHSYKMRKRSQIQHAEFALAKAERALSKLEHTDREFDNLFAGRPDYWDGLNFNL